jgi:hypothetical protein
MPDQRTHDLKRTEPLQLLTDYLFLAIDTINLDKRTIKSQNPHPSIYLGDIAQSVRAQHS